VFPIHGEFFRKAVAVQLGYFHLDLDNALTYLKKLPHLRQLILPSRRCRTEPIPQWEIDMDKKLERELPGVAMVR
jgi:hypothetical protein